MLRGEFIENYNEVMVSKAIMKIPQYSDYFSPILESCPFDIRKLNPLESAQCPVMKTDLEKIHTQNHENEENEIRDSTLPGVDGNEDGEENAHENNGNNNENNENKIENEIDMADINYITSTMKYVGDESVEDYLIDKINENVLLGVEYTYNLHKHLLQSLNQLHTVSDPIIHFDIKSNNIIIDDIFHKPILIDFGFSFTKKYLVKSSNKIHDLDFYFWSYQSTHDQSFVINWCLEVDILCYIVQVKLKKNDGKLDDIIHSNDINDLHTTIDNYIHKTELKRNLLLTTTDIDNYTIDMKNYIKNFHNLNWKFLIDNLIETWTHWDNYSLALMFSNFIQKKNGDYRSNPFIGDYTDILRDSLLSVPGKGIVLNPRNMIDLLENTWMNYKYMKGP